MRKKKQEENIRKSLGENKSKLKGGIKQSIMRGVLCSYAALTNDKTYWLKIIKPTLLQFWRSEVQTTLNVLLRESSELISSRKSRGDSLSLPFQLLKVPAFLGSWPLPVPSKPSV